MTRRGTLVRHPIALTGVVLATTGAVIFGALVVAELWGLFNNPYSGLVVFVAVPAIFVAGLLLIPLGMWLEHRRLQRHPHTEREWFVFDFRSAVTRRWAMVILMLTAINI
jgi:hypothetical protein